VNNARLGVSAFAAEGEFGAVQVEPCSVVAQQVHGSGGLASDLRDHVGIRQVTADPQCVARVLGRAVAGREGRGDAALGVEGGRLAGFVLSHNQHFAFFGGLQGGHQSGQARPQHQRVREQMGQTVMLEVGQVPAAADRYAHVWARTS
jgi:hypothetical protein